MIGRVLKQALSSRIRCGCGNLFPRKQLLAPVSTLNLKSTSFSSSKILWDTDEGKTKIENGASFAERFQSSKATEEQIIESQSVLSSHDPQQDDSQGFSDFGILIPTLETFDVLYDGVPFSELPIAYVHCSKNNTIISIMNHTNTKHSAQMSGGLCGFKNAAKSTSVAGQTAGYSVGQIARQKGIKNLRVVLKGFGKGRFAAIQGMKLAGMNIVSISDKSVDHQTYRPRKIRRV